MATKSRLTAPAFLFVAIAVCGGQLVGCSDVGDSSAIPGSPNGGGTTGATGEEAGASTAGAEAGVDGGSDAAPDSTVFADAAADSALPDAAGDMGVASTGTNTGSSSGSSGAGTAVPDAGDQTQPATGTTLMQPDAGYHPPPDAGAGPDAESDGGPEADSAGGFDADIDTSIGADSAAGPDAENGADAEVDAAADVAVDVSLETSADAAADVSADVANEGTVPDAAALQANCNAFVQANNTATTDAGGPFAASDNGVCTGTELILYERDVTGRCLACAFDQGILDETFAGLSYLECEDLLSDGGTGAVSECLAVLACDLGVQADGAVENSAVGAANGASLVAAYCGTGATTSVCEGSGAGQGPIGTCAAQWTAAFPSTFTPTTIVTMDSDQTYPGGMANRLVSTLIGNLHNLGMLCATTCFQ
jgi:hypothetical protein